MIDLLRFKPLIAILMITVLVSCSRAPQVIGVPNPDVPVDSVANLTKHKVFIMSTRGSGMSRCLLKLA